MLQTPYHVLIVDDEELVRRLVVRALSREGILCDEASDGIEASDMLRARQYDAVITDLRMPNKHGHALTLELLNLKPRPLIVILTGVTEPRLVRDLTSRGVAEICFKPVEFPEFAAKIKARLQARSKPQANAQCQHARFQTARQTIPTQMASPSNTPASLRAKLDQTKQNIVILLKDGDYASQLANSLTTDAVNAIAAENSETLCLLVNERLVDLLVIEEKLSGFFNGLDILERLGKELVHPEAILLAERSQRINEWAAAHDVEYVIDSSIRFDEVVQRVKDVLALMEKPKGFIPQAAQRLVQQYENLPTMPQLVVRLVDYMRLDSVELPVSELARDIAADSQATAELLRLINSSSVGLRRDISSVLEAVNYLGSKRAISMLLSSATVKAQSDLLSGWSELLRDWYHQRTVLIASTASTFAERFESVSPDTAFVLGLLQEIGILVLANSDKNRYFETTLRRSRKVPQVLLHAAEQEDYRITHAEVSAALLKKWELPQSLIGSILDHHELRGQQKHSEAERSLLRVMRIGEAFANMSDNPHTYRSRKLNDLLTYYGAARSRQCEACFAKATARTLESCKMFSMPVPDQAKLRQLIHEVTASGETEALVGPTC